MLVPPQVSDSAFIFTQLSSRNHYDTGEPRRSRSPPTRYNDYREETSYRERGGGARGGERRGSISDSRIGPSFQSGRDGMRDTMGRGSRDFPPREIPRGPKALLNDVPSGPPSGPRAAGYGGDYRGDFGFRGRGRGARGRGANWRDDSRDRSREADRDYRGPRDDRGSLPFRDERSRDRDRWDRNDSFHGRRPSSPQGRGRSPNYGIRETRDSPSTLDMDRARRGSRDGPLSGGSPSSDSLQAFRGFGRGRGTRGRGRGGYYDDYPNRNPSPDPGWGRRTQPSATPPPQVPAFGSTTTNLPVPPTAPKIPTAPAQKPPTGPAALESISGIPVPTAPRAHAQSHATSSRLNVGRDNRTGISTIASKKWVNPDLIAAKKSTSDFSALQPSVLSPTKALAPRPESAGSQSHYRNDDRPSSNENHSNLNRHPEPRPENSRVARRITPNGRPNNGRKPIIKRTFISKVKSSPQPASNGDFSPESADSLDLNFINERIGKFQDQISRLPKNPDDDPLDIAKIAALADISPPAEDDTEQMTAWESELERYNSWRQKKYNQQLLELSSLRPRTEIHAPFLVPFINAMMDTELKAKIRAILRSANGPIPAECVPVTENPPTITPGTTQHSLAPKAPSRGRSRPVSPLVEPISRGESMVNGQNGSSSKAEAQQLQLPILSHGATPSIESSGSDITDSSARPANSMSSTQATSSSKGMLNGITGRPKLKFEMLPEDRDVYATPEEREQHLEAVRARMKTPPLSSLPTFDVKKWNFDPEYLQTLEPDASVEEYLRIKMQSTIDRRKREQMQEGHAWSERYYRYRQWTDTSDDPACIRSREKFAKARAAAAADTSTVKASTPAPNAKPEPTRRGRFATEHDIERVLRESEQEANEAKAREIARAATATAKEATIPAMCWDQEECEESSFADLSGLVPFDRSLAVFQVAEPIDNFTEYEKEIFETTYIDSPKNWTQITAALPNRDTKGCIQHYYLVKHETNLKEKSKKQGKKRGRAKGPPKGTKPRSNVLMDVVQDDGDDQENENGSERRRPKRAAAPTFNFENPADSEGASPAPTPSRKTAGAPKAPNGGDAAPTKRKVKTPREKVSKQAKNSQLLAAAPTTTPRGADSPSAQPPSNLRESTSANRHPAQYDNSVGNQANFVPSPYLPTERITVSTNASLEAMSQTFPGQVRDAATPMTFDSQDRRNNPQHTSSYWSVPEQTDFPDLLRHFGTDWHGIAKHMTSKTHIMVYTTVFQQWLAVPVDGNKSRRDANIREQVKNYYQRHVDHAKPGTITEWEAISREADDKRQRGESTGPLPTPTAIPTKTRGHLGSGARLGSAVDGMEDIPDIQNAILHQASPTQPTMSSRFPALAQAGPVPQTLSQPATPTSFISKHHPTQQSTRHPSQQAQSQVRPPQGPALGFFNTDPQRPIMQAGSSHGPSGASASDPAHSQRLKMAQQEAEIEKKQALAVQAQAERQQIMQQQQQQQQVMQRDMLRDRQFQLKQETEGPSLQQYEPYSTPSAHANTVLHSRPEISNQAMQPDIRRTAPPQQYQARTHQAVRNILSDNPSGRDMKPISSPAIPRAPLSAPPTTHEQYNVPPMPSMPPAGPPRQAEPVSRRSNIMSLLNDPEPSEPARPTPSKRVSDVGSALQTSHTPPPQHALQPSRYTSHPLPVSQPIQQIPHQIATHIDQQHQHQHQTQVHHSYSQPPQHVSHQHSASLSLSRSYTPNSFEPRAYAAPPALQQQSQQQIYSQPPRQSMTSQAPPIRREPSHGEFHSLAGGYARTSMPSQSAPRLKESPFSASPSVPPSQSSRQQAASPLDLAQPSERDYYARQAPFHLQQQSSEAGSPQLGPSYHPQPQQGPPSNHRHLAFGQSSSHVASPPTQYATQHPLHRSRHNSFDSGSRYTITATSAPTTTQQGYAPAPQHQTQHQGPSMSMQYQQQQQQQQQQHIGQERFETRYPAEIRRREDELYHQRSDDSRRR